MSNPARHGEAAHWMYMARRNVKQGKPQWDGFTPEMIEGVRAIRRIYDAQRRSSLREYKRQQAALIQRPKGEPPPGAPPYLTAETAPRSIGGKA